MSWRFFPLVGKPQEVKNDNDLFKSISPGSRFLELKKTLNWNPQRTVKIQCKPKIQRFSTFTCFLFLPLKKSTRMIVQFSPLSSGYFPALSSAHTNFFFRLAPRSSIRFFFRPGASDMQLSMHVVLPQKVHCIYKYWFIQQSRWKRDWRKDFEQ